MLLLVSVKRRRTNRGGDVGGGDSNGDDDGSSRGRGGGRGGTLCDAVVAIENSATDFRVSILFAYAQFAIVNARLSVVQ